MLNLEAEPPCSRYEALPCNEGKPKIWASLNEESGVSGNRLHIA
jgi:hypothetical protein